MRIVHHSTLIEAGSGMMCQVLDFVRSERRAGLDSGVVCTQEINKAGGKTISDIVTSSWEWANEKPDDTVHVIHSHVPKDLSAIKNKIIVLHGTPEQCVFEEIWHNRYPLTTSVNLIQACDKAITLIPRHEQYWKLFDHTGKKVVAVNGGIDIQKYNPNGKKFPYSAKPSILCAESYYSIKVPTSFILAVKEVVKTLPRARGEMLALSEGMFVFWKRFIDKSYSDMHFDAMIKGRVKNIEDWYRGASVYVSMALNGDLSRCGMEAMACGTPTISIKSEYSNNYPEWTCENNPSDVAKKIIEIHNIMQSDEKGTRAKARKIAEERYDITNTTRQMKKIYEELLNKPADKKDIINNIVTNLNYNALRFNYNDFTFDEYKQIYNGLNAKIQPQKFYDVAFFEKAFADYVKPDMTVIEMGSYDGSLANEILQKFKVKSWTGYDVSSYAIKLKQPTNPTFKNIELQKQIWETDIPKSNVFVNSDTIEHLTDNEVKKLFDFLPTKADILILQVDIPPKIDNGYKNFCAHMMDIKIEEFKSLIEKNYKITYHKSDKNDIENKFICIKK